MQRILGGTNRAVYRVGACLVLVAGCLAWLTPQHLAALLALHALWATVVFGMGELAGRNILSPARCGQVSSAVGILVLPAIVHLHVGPGANVAYAVLVAMPLVVAAMAPEDRTSVLVFFGGSLVWIVLLGRLSGAPPFETPAKLLVALLCGGIAVAATYAQDRTRNAEKQAVDARVAALQRLADSERRRMQSDRLAVVGKLASGTAHEINNPLMVVVGNLGYLRLQLESQGELDPDTSALLTDMDNAVERMRQVVQAMAQFARSDPEGKPALAFPAHAVQQALEVLAARTRNLGTVDNAVPQGTPGVRLHPTALLHVLVTLLLNAVESLEAAGQPANQNRIRVATAQAPPGHLTLLVEDNGPGFSPDVLPDVFEPYFTTKGRAAGPGLGLAVCREYVTGAGGTITADSRPGGGARVTLCLPLCPPADVAHALANAEKPLEPEPSPDATAKPPTAQD